MGWESDSDVATDKKSHAIWKHQVCGRWEQRIKVRKVTHVFPRGSFTAVLHSNRKTNKAVLNYCCVCSHWNLEIRNGGKHQLKVAAQRKYEPLSYGLILLAKSGSFFLFLRKKARGCFKFKTLSIKNRRWSVSNNETRLFLCITWHS